MKQTRILMGMPISVEILDSTDEALMEAVYGYFTYVDETFSTYKDGSEITKLNRGILPETELSADMKLVLALCEETKKLSNGYFDIKQPDGSRDPSGLVKGWSIQNAAQILDEKGVKNFYIDAGGDIQTRGKNAEGKMWSVGIKNPFKQEEVVKAVYLSGEGIATSGTYIRGQHIYNPKATEPGPITEIISLTVIGPNVYEADRFATAAFAMGLEGIHFIEGLPGFEGYIIDKNGIATMTNGFEKYTHPYA